jgi:hypothetical protein
MITAGQPASAGFRAGRCRTALRNQSSSPRGRAATVGADRMVPSHRPEQPAAVGYIGRVSKTVVWLLVAIVLLPAATGCLIPIYSGDPIRRSQELIYSSEDLRAISDEWERIWFLDQPSHMTPYRTHGGIL